MLKQKYKLAIFAGATAAGAAHGFLTGTPGHRSDYAKEGALTGALAGGGLIAAPKLVKWGAGKAKAAMSSAAKKGYASGKVVFRRVRGRLIPIRMK